MILRLLLVVALAGCSSDGDATATDARPADDASVDGDGPIAGTTGCGLASTITPNQYVLRTITVANVTRTYAIRIPTDYDPQRRYPVIYQQHGCFPQQPDHEINNVPLDAEVGTDAIIVRGRAAGACWDTSTSGPDIPFWDAMVADVEATWCIDPATRYLTGYSSGAFMTHRLGCIRGDKLRGIATIAGGQAESGCSSTVAALLIHDSNDPTVNIGASIAARDSHLTRNGCDKLAPPTPTDHPPCVVYSGCTAGAPVVWCETSGQAHSRQDGLAAPIFWDFFSNL